MNPLIEEILSDMKAAHNITKYELERIIDTQFKVLALHIENRDLREVHIKGIGKFKPTTFLKAMQEGRVIFRNGQQSKKMI
jgi:nucleoid DNA-binding protein